MERFHIKPFIARHIHRLNKLHSNVREQSIAFAEQIDNSQYNHQPKRSCMPWQFVRKGALPAQHFSKYLSLEDMVTLLNTAKKITFNCYPTKLLIATLIKHLGNNRAPIESPSKESILTAAALCQTYLVRRDTRVLRRAVLNKNCSMIAPVVHEPALS